MTQTRTRSFGLSKSKITAFEQCPKRLWLATHRPELAEQDAGAEARFAVGNAVGELACALHPGGFMVDAPTLSAALATTASLIAGGHPGPIFEATFEHDGVLVRVDVLERLAGGGWAAAEVKSSTSVKDYHRGDLATQVWVMREAGSLLVGRFTKSPADKPQSDWMRSMLLAAATVAAGYGALWLVDQLFLTDFRLWVVAVKLPDFRQLGIAAIYVVPITFSFLVMARSLSTATVRGDTGRLQYMAAILTLTGGFMVVLSVIYGFFFVSGSLITAFDPLSTVIALQFVPVLAAVAIIGIFTWRRTGSYRPGGLIAGVLVTLYVVAGTATQV